MALSRVVLPGRGPVSLTALEHPSTAVSLTAPRVHGTGVPGVGAGHTSDVDDEQIKPSATVGVRVMAAIILVSSIALLISGAIVWVLGRQTLHADIDEQLNRGRQRLEQLATAGIDPSNGQSFTDASSVVRAYIRQSVVGAGESVLGFESQTLSWHYSSAETDRQPQEDKQLVDHLASMVTARDSTTTTVRTAQSTYRVMVVPLRDGTTQVALAHIIDLDTAEASLRRTMMLYGVAAVFTVALVAALAWFVVERLLAPIGELRMATESIGSQDLSARVPVHGRDDLGILARAVNRMLDRVQHSVEAERSMLDDVGHELRTPITIIRGHLELLDPTDTEDVSRTRSLAIEELDRMGSMANDLLELARTSGTDSFVPKPTDVSELTASVFDKAQVLGPRVWVLEESANTVCDLDAQRLSQAWLQLAANAVKYSEAGSRVTLGSRVKDDHLLLWVTDQGIGIAPEELELVRQRFWRGSNAESMATGTGLGLSIVENIVSAHQGTLDINSVAGTGSQFTMRIPCGRDHGHHPRGRTTKGQLS